MEEKTCVHCNETKKIDNFWFDKKRNWYYSKCKRCKYELNKLYTNVSKEKKAEYDKTYRKKHANELKERKRNEYERNKDKYINRQLEYRKTIEGKLKHNIRTRISNCIKRKTNSSFELLGCDITFYLNYIEHLLEKDMTWENYGTYWHIDHVKQLKEFDLTDETSQKEAFNWKNTRPLKVYDNLSKRMNTTQDIEHHKKIIEKFLIATSSNCGDILIV